MRSRNAISAYVVGIVVISIFSGMPMMYAEAKDGSFGGGDGTAGNPYLIEDVWDLQNMSSNLSAHYVLGNDVDASVTAGWNSGAGFTPVGINTSKFTGSLDGRDHTITGLSINRTDSSYIGLFGYLGPGASVANVGLVDVNVTGRSYVAGLVGNSWGTVFNSYSGGSVTGANFSVGGLVGISYDGVIDSCHSSADVDGTATIREAPGVGGLVGYIFRSTVTDCHASGRVVGGGYQVGGLIGGSNDGTVSGCSATGEVVGAGDFVGGLVGRDEWIKVTGCHATGNVTGGCYVGGLLGCDFARMVANSYATGQVSGKENVGGLVGVASGGTQSDRMSDSYSVGNVTGERSVGGLLGGMEKDTKISNCHYCIDDVSINGGHHLTAGGLFDAQYDEWFSNGLSLSISDYSTTLVPAGQTYEISGVQGLRDFLGFADVVGYDYRLAADIDLSTAPGLYIPYLAGALDGDGHKVSNLRLDMPFASALGLVGFIVKKDISDLAVVDCKVVGADNVGGLAGFIEQGTVYNSYATGNVTGRQNVGGLVGSGGATRCFAAVDVIGESVVGGLMGYTHSDQILDSYATGSVTGDEIVGGLLGSQGWWINNCYSVGRVVGNMLVGGLVGEEGASVVKCFWDTETSNQSSSPGGTGKTTAEMMTRSTFTGVGWDFTKTWAIMESVTYPFLRWQDLEPPSANASADRTVDEDTVMAFDGGNSTDDNRIVAYTWTFMDGAKVTLHGVAPEYRFDNPGVFVVTLNVTDAMGRCDTDTMNVTVRDVTPPLADAGLDRTVDEGTKVLFVGSDSEDNVGIVNYTWSFTDVVPVVLYGDYPKYLFGRPGMFVVTLTVADLAGNRGTDTMTITVLDTTAPVAIAGGDVAINQGDTLVLNGTASTDNVGIVSWIWSFEDVDRRVRLEGPTAPYTFEHPGAFAVVLEVEDAAGNTGTVGFVITVKDTVPPVADAGPDRTIDERSVVDLDGSLSHDNMAIVRFTWTFRYRAEDVVLSGATSTFAFWTPGVYTVTLNVTDAAGNWDQDDMVLTIRDLTAPVAMAGPDRTVPAGQNVTVDGSASYDNFGIADYTWTLTVAGVPETFHGKSMNRTFPEAGVYQITLTVLDEAGNVDNDTVVLTVVDTGTVTGTVLDRDGRPVEGALVEASDGSGSLRRAVTGPDGTFMMGVHQGPFTWNVSKKGYRTVGGSSSVSPMNTTVLDLSDLPLVKEDEEALSGPSLMILAVVVILLVIGVVLFLIKKRKGRPEG